MFPTLGWLPLGGLALGFSVSNVIEVGLLLWLLRGKLGGLDGRSLLSALLRMGAAAVAMAVGIAAALAWLPDSARLGAGAHRHGGGRPALSAGVSAATG